MGYGGIHSGCHDVYGKNVEFVVSPDCGGKRKPYPCVVVSLGFLEWFGGSGIPPVYW